MAVRDLLWGCPICHTAGSIRPQGKREVCRSCDAAFRRARGARILAEHGGTRQERDAADWLALLGPVRAPHPDAAGVILGPEQVRVKLTRRHNPLHWGGELIGWVEDYTRTQRGTMTMVREGLHFQPTRGPELRWGAADLTGLQPASSTLQLGLHGRMASVKFVEGSVRLWTRALADLLQRYYLERGHDVLELQPCVRTCRIRSAS